MSALVAGRARRKPWRDRSARPAAGGSRSAARPAGLGAKSSIDGRYGRAHLARSSSPSGMVCLAGMIAARKRAEERRHDRVETERKTPKAVYIIAATPFTDDGALDLQSLDTLTDFYLRCGVHGFTLLGIMGEAPKLTPDESISVVNRVIARRRRQTGDRGREPRRPGERPSPLARSHDCRRLWA